MQCKNRNFCRLAEERAEQQNRSFSYRSGLPFQVLWGSVLTGKIKAVTIMKINLRPSFLSGCLFCMSLCHKRDLKREILLFFVQSLTVHYSYTGTGIPLHNHHDSWNYHYIKWNGTQTTQSRLLPTTLLSTLSVLSVQKPLLPNSQATRRADQRRRFSQVLHTADRSRGLHAHSIVNYVMHLFGLIWGCTAAGIVQMRKVFGDKKNLLVCKRRQLPIKLFVY